MTSALLPNELWGEICRHSATSELFNLSLVSRVIHDIAASFLFHTINIYILHHVELYIDHPQSTFHQLIENRVEHAHRSWGILNKIVTDVRFASFVKALRVHAASEETFEILSIANAIKHLPNLRSLHWFHTLLPVVLCNEMPKSIRRLHVPGFFSLSPFLRPPCNNFEELYILEELPRFTDGAPIYNFIDKEYKTQIVPLFLENLGTLRNVSLSSADMAALPVRSFENLSSLEIYYRPMSTNSGLDLVLRHISNLTELALTGCVPDDFLMTLEANPSAHPHLHSFCITSDGSTPKNLAPAGLATIARFLAGRPELKRVFLDVVTTPWDALIDTVLVPSLSKLPSLVTLGLQVRYPALPSTLQTLCQVLPPHIEALHVLWYSDLAPQGIPLIHSLVEGVSHCPRLSYLSAASNDFLPYGEVASLVSELANVRTVSLDGYLWDIDVGGSTLPGLGPDKTATQWSDLQVESCHEGSLRHPDDYWLFRFDSNDESTNLSYIPDIIPQKGRAWFNSLRESCFVPALTPGESKITRSDVAMGMQGSMPTPGASAAPPSLFTQTPGTMLPGYEFNASDADIILVPNDPEPFEFRVHKCVLAVASPFFRTMFSLSQPDNPGSDAPSLPLIPVSEPKSTIEVLLQFVYPIPDPPIRTLEELTTMLGAAIKYEFECLVTSLRKLLVSPHSLQSQPVRVFAIACRFDLDDEAKTASRYTLRVNVLDCPLSDDLKHISADSYHQLLDLHRRRPRTAQELTVYLPDSVKCALCTGSTHALFRSPKWWKEFESRAKERLAITPTTDGIFEREFLAGCANAAECQRCFESFCSAWPFLQEMKARIDALPATI
ncbi:hypothetical protein BDN71DRAFT_1585085 [Pleurotus eryngii]|uniref:BTB domain-containing protein n=1 Tax=Pleurotus eryngii TaxID=5323 RepID=A0A9P6DK33_PLEER|nr:hypothetical protein BDN71DRAFT_1585085 [Pleurotus eryngii]